MRVAIPLLLVISLSAGVALAQTAAPTTAATANEKEQVIKSALMNCFSAFSPKIPVASDPKTIPPGLIEGQKINVVSLPGTDGRAFSYEGARNDPSCGIAIYGPVSSSLQKEIRQLIDSDSRWKPQSPDFYKLSGIPAEDTYWGVPRAPGLSGVHMLVRTPGPDAPTLEVEYHTILIH